MATHLLSATMDGRGLLATVAAMLAIAVVSSGQPITQPQSAPSPNRDQTSALPANGPTFAVASVKPNRSDELGAQLHLAPDGSFVARNEPLPALLEFAYGYPHNRIHGLPDWAFRERFDITAKSDAASPSSPEHIALMLRSLLDDRFTLRTRIEVRQIPVYELRLDRSDRRFGPSLTETTRADCAALARGQRVPSAQLREAGDAPCGISNASGFISARGVLAGQLAEALGRFVDRPVVDRTALRNVLDADIRFRQDGPAFPFAGVPLDVPPDTNAAAIFTAIREQLGLRLVPARGDVGVLVVSSIDRPTAD